jgi:pilus assembly protein CpaB
MRIALVLVVAALIVGLTAFYMYTLIDRPEEGPAIAETGEPRITGVQVLVADGDLKAGTILNDGNFQWQTWPDESLDDSFITRTSEEEDDATQDIAGSVVRRGIVDGEPLTFAKVFKRDDPGFLAGALSPGMRAVALPISAVTSAAGFILPGDRVDVILTQRFSDSDDDEGGAAGPTDQALKIAGETVVRNIRVLAIDQKFDDFEEAAEVGKTVTLELTPKQVEILSVAAVLGEITLSLRSLVPGDDDDYGGYFTSDQEVSEAVEGGNAAAWRKASAASSGAGDGAMSTTGETGESVMEGDQAELVLALWTRRALEVGSLIGESDFEWRETAANQLPEGTYVVSPDNPGSPRGALVVKALGANTPVTDSAILQAYHPDFLARAVAPGMGTVDVGAKAALGLAEVISVGDQVELTVFAKLRILLGDGIGSPRMTSRALYSDLRVLAVNRDTGTPVR